MTCLCGNASALPVASRCVDAAICVAMLHHVAEPAGVRATLQEMIRVVKPGGCLLVWDHNRLNPYWPNLMRRLPQDQEPTRLVPLGELLADLVHPEIGRVGVWRLGLVPDFAPASLLWFFRGVEWFVERLPGLRLLCAHNVVLVTKAAASSRSEGS